MVCLLLNYLGVAVHQARHRTDGSKWSIRPRSLAALAVAAAGLAASIWLPGRNDAASAAVSHPAFADDFTGARGSALDFSRWNLDGDPDNGVQDGDGNLTVTRLLRTRESFDQRDGHAEARIEASRAPGVWRALGVLDRYGRLIPGRLQTLRGGIDPTDGDSFHTYAIDWSPKAVVWSVDGHPSLRLLPAHAPDGIVLVLNLATDGTPPVRMTVDFVHVLVYGRYGPPPTPPSSAPSGSSSSAATPPASPSDSPSPTAASPSASTASPEPTTASPKPKPTPSKAPAAAPWKPYTNYQAGDLVTYDGVTYKVREAHTSLPGWEPPTLPSLFQKVG
jgi:cell division septation protein DedD